MSAICSYLGGVLCLQYKQWVTLTKDYCVAINKSWRGSAHTNQFTGMCNSENQSTLQLNSKEKHHHIIHQPCCPTAPSHCGKDSTYQTSVSSQMFEILEIVSGGLSGLYFYL